MYVYIYIFLILNVVLIKKTLREPVTTKRYSCWVFNKSPAARGAVLKEIGAFVGSPEIKVRRWKKTPGNCFARLAMRLASTESQIESHLRFAGKS